MRISRKIQMFAGFFGFHWFLSSLCRLNNFEVCKGNKSPDRLSNGNNGCVLWTTRMRSLGVFCVSDGGVDEHVIYILLPRTLSKNLQSASLFIT